MTGWRIGWMAAPKWFASACNVLQGQYTSGPNSVAQKAAEAAYTGDQTCLSEMRAAFERRKNLVVAMAREIPGLKVNDPQGAFYVFPDASYYIGKAYKGKVIENSGDLAMYLLEVGHVACVGGGAFGAPNCIRMSYATADDILVKAFARIKEALANLETV